MELSGGARNKKDFETKGVQGAKNRIRWAQTPWGQKREYHLLDVSSNLWKSIGSGVEGKAAGEQWLQSSEGKRVKEEAEGVRINLSASRQHAGASGKGLF